MSEKKKFCPLEIDGLLEKARKGDLIARDELLFRFQRLAATLVNVCISGRPNTWSSYQMKFLKLFGAKGTPATNIAMMLKKELSIFEKDELFSTGQLAILIAIEKCETNLASTIVFCFKDLIHKMIKDGQNVHEPLVYQDVEYNNLEDNVAWSIFLESLSEEDKEVVERLLDGEIVENISEKLKSKVLEYFL